MARWGHLKSFTKHSFTRAIFLYAIHFVFLRFLFRNNFSLLLCGIFAMSHLDGPDFIQRLVGASPVLSHMVNK